MVKEESYIVCDFMEVANELWFDVQVSVVQVDITIALVMNYIVD